jgi:hypothetical protein
MDNVPFELLDSAALLWRESYGGGGQIVFLNLITIISLSLGHPGRGGRGGREREEYRVDRRQGYNADYDRSSDQSGRHMAPEPHRSVRGARGGQYDYRARPY